jgi:hypothetical protein
LGDGHEEIILSNNWISISKFRPDICLHWDSAKLFDEKLPHEGGMVRGATGNQVNPPNLLQELSI